MFRDAATSGSCAAYAGCVAALGSAHACVYVYMHMYMCVCVVVRHALGASQHLDLRMYVYMYVCMYDVYMYNLRLCICVICTHCSKKNLYMRTHALCKHAYTRVMCISTHRAPS